MRDRWIVAAAVAACVAGGAWALQPADGQRPQRPGGAMTELGGQMVEQLRGVEGCLGAEAGRIAGNKVFIVAWFENKAAAMRWYDHPMHQRLMKAANMEDDKHEEHAEGKDDDHEEHEEMEGVPDDLPVMAIATMEFGGPPAVEGSQIPFSAISIELYTAVKGGLRINGGFAPDGWYDLIEKRSREVHAEHGDRGQHAAPAGEQR